VWALSGQWVNQHEPALLPNGNILLFDNKGRNGMSKVIEFDPLTQMVVWAYEGTPENGFYTESSGAAYRLSNGNTLIIESNAGRAFEVNDERRIVWEYYNPERAGDDDELIATLFDVVRLPPDFPVDWLAGPASGGGSPFGSPFRSRC
jgi:dipeptidyl aminopeptidase/acylaminoacyl peptidase